MTMKEEYTDFSVQKSVELLAIDSPTGYTSEAAEFVIREFSTLGFKAQKTVKGGIIVDIGGPDTPEGSVLFAAHTDTLGGMVAEIKNNGRLRITNIGGLNANDTETENCRIITKFSGAYEGTLQLINASIHVNPEYSKEPRNFDSVEVVIDEPVYSKEDVEALGINVGDIVCFDPRTRITSSGYIKSRFLDDKLSVGILMGLAKVIRDEKPELKRHIYFYITVYEEVGHGASGSIPENVSEIISVDMGCIGEGLQCNEH